MSEVTSGDVRTKKASETRGVLVDFTEALDLDTSIDETIASVSSVTASGLTITGAAVTTVLRKCNEKYVKPGKGVTFTVAGGSNGSDYTILVVVVTSGGQTLDRSLTLQVRAS